MDIPFVDLLAQYCGIKSEVDAAVLGGLGIGQYLSGDQVARFEKAFAKYCQAKFAAGVNSGVSALHLALLAADIGPGDEVITVSLNFVAATAAIVYAGARPVFVDVTSDSCTMDVDQIEGAITNRTRAIIPAHLYGQMANMDPIMAIARKHNLIVIEDASQAHGAEYKGCRAGSIGDLGCFCFSPGKNLGAYGTSGLVVTSNPEYEQKIRVLRNWGAEREYHHNVKGFDYGMEELQAAILSVKLLHLEDWTESRRSLARQYNQLLAEGGPQNLPRELANRRHVCHIYAVRTPLRNELQRELQERGIQTAIHYPIPVHRLQAHADLGYKTGDLPVTEQIAREELSLPMFAELTEDQVSAVAEVVREVMRDGA